MANNRRGGAVSLTGPGTVFTLAFIALAIGMGVLMSRGITPSSTLTEPENTGGDVEVILETPAPGQKGLQLKTIKFRECSSKVAVGMLVDRSGSMEGGKIVALRAALNTFLQSMNDQSVVGLASFSSNDNGAIVVREDIPYSRYKDVKAMAPRAISNLNAFGATNTRTALTFVKNKILAAQKAFPDQKFALIVMSDGIPEHSSEQYTVQNPGGCPSGRYHYSSTGNNYRCFALSEDPTRDPDVSREIKDAGIKIYTIALYDSKRADDVYFLPDMRKMMEQIATLPTTSTYYELPDASKLKQIYQDIAQKICSDSLSPTPTP